MRAASIPSALEEAPGIRRLLTALALGFLALFLLLPLGAVFVYALGEGPSHFAAAVLEPAALSAFRLTLASAAVAVAVNLVGGVAAAWLLARFEFRGRSLLAALVDVPFSVSPIIVGLMLVLLFGSRGWFGPGLAERGVQVLFSFPGIALATVFVTFPLVAREVLAVLQTGGAAEEEAALTLGASGWQTFLRVTLPRIKWGLFHGVVLSTARAMGEFGAVSVVSGHIQGRTNTVPLHVEVLFNEYRTTAAFSVASILALLGLATLAARKLVEARGPSRGRRLAAARPT